MDLSKPVGQFSDSLFKLMVTSDNKENTLVSPLSIHIALSMLLHGVRNKSESQLKCALKLLPEADANQVAKYYNSLLASLAKEDEQDIVLINNKALVSKLFPLMPDYANVLKSKYLSTIEEVDFRRHGPFIMNQVNQWVNESTKGLIPSILQEPLDEETALVLLNCVYFKGNWKGRFDLSGPRDFHLSNTQSKKVPFMEVIAHFKYLTVPFGSSGGQVQMVDIPYKGRCSMVVILPPESTTVNEMIAEMPLFDMLMQILANGQCTKISLHMPKFTFRSDQEMNDVLKKMGAVDIFDETKADLSGISSVKSPPLYVSGVQHSALIEVDEEGTKAAAVTMVRISKFAITLFLLAFLIISFNFVLS